MNQLDLIVFNVGHGLSVALVEKPENYVILIDLGASTGFTPLKHLDLKLKLKPDILYITHPHADHLDDINTALTEKFRPLGLNFQDYDWEDVKKRELKELAFKIDRFRNLQAVVPRKDYAGKANLEPWRFTPDDAKKNFGDASYVNNSSLFLVYRWRDFKIAIAGDLESDGMDALVATQKFQEAAKNTQILIPAHHGHKNGFPVEWVANIGKPYVSIISVQSRDESLDSRYSSPDFARGVTFGGEKRFRLTTRADGNILVSMWYSTDAKPTWEFESF
jgi:beta-lactamase superfamily II metal-dependent hydrolase